MRTHTRTCPCCGSVVSAAIHPDDFACPNGKRRARGGKLVVDGSTTIRGGLTITGPKGSTGVAGGELPSPGAGMVMVNITGGPDPSEIANLVMARRQMMRA